MTDIHQRICAVSKEIEKTDNRIDYLTQKRKKLEIRKKTLENEELLEIIRTNGANVTTLSDDLLLGKLIRENNITATVTYFVPCDDIENEAYMIKGSYETVTGVVKNVDLVINKSIVIDETRILLSNVVKIECSKVFDYDIY